MVHSCAAMNCTARWRKGVNTKFHRIPIKNTNLRTAWLYALSRSNYDPKYGFVCEKHFLKDDYEMNAHGNKCLKKGTVPSVFDFPGQLKEMKERSILRQEVTVGHINDNVDCSGSSSSDQDNLIEIEVRHEEPENELPEINVPDEEHPDENISKPTTLRSRCDPIQYSSSSDQVCNNHLIEIEVHENELSEMNVSDEENPDENISKPPTLSSDQVCNNNLIEIEVRANELSEMNVSDENIPKLQTSCQPKALRSRCDSVQCSGNSDQVCSDYLIEIEVHDEEPENELAGINVSDENIPKLPALIKQTFFRNRRNPVFFGDFILSDLDDEEKRKRFWKIAHETVYKYRKSIKYHQTIVTRQRNKIQGLSDLLAEKILRHSYS